MSNKKAIVTSDAPTPSGPYSQAIKVGRTVYLAGQVAKTAGDFVAEATQVFHQLSAVAQAAGGSLNDIVKLTVFLMDLKNFPLVNDVMKTLFKEPYPARSTFQVAALPGNSAIEVEAIMELSHD